MSQLRTEALAAQFVQAKADARRSPRTIEKYRGALGRFARRCPILPTEPGELEEYLRTGATWSDRTLDTHFGNLKTFYTWLLRRHLIWDNPFDQMDRPRVSKKLPRVLSVEEVRRLIEVTRPPYERALILTLIDAGPRIGELAGCTKGDLNGNELMVTGKTGERKVILSPPVAAYLRELPTYNLFPKLGQSGGPGLISGVREVIDEPRSVDSLQEAVRRTFDHAGLQGPKSGPHTLRHTFATMFLKKSGDLYALARLLGHTSVRMAEKYVHLDVDDLVDLQRDNSPIWSVMGLQPATPEKMLPPVELPESVRDSPPFDDEDEPVRIFLAEDRRPGRTWYYIRARAGRRRWQLASLGHSLPLDVVDSYRRLIAEENRRRESLADILISGP